MSSRIEKIKETYSKQLQERLDQENIDISLHSAWDILISADPTQKQKHVRWLVETYINNGFLWEDIIGGPLSKASETLTEFDKHKRNLETSQRSLMKYETLGSLWSAIKPYVGQLTPGEEKREERERAYAESEVVVDREDGFKIIVPLTEYASKWWGRGTRWCTSADHDNAFYAYARENPLFIIMMPNGDKLQLWNDSHEIQFMDENDETVTKKYIEEHWEHLREICLWLGDIQYTPHEFLTQDIVDISLQKSLHNVRYISPEFFNKGIVDTIIERKECHLLKYVPEHMLPAEVCQEIFDYYYDLFVEKGDDIKDVRVQIDNILADNEIFKMLKNLPEKNIDKLLDMNTELLYHLPRKYISRDILRKHILKYGDVQNYYSVPNDLIHLLNKDDLMYIFDNNPRFMINFPPEVITPELCIKAIETDPENIAYIPKEFLTKELCDFSFSKFSGVIISIPEKYLTMEMYHKAVSDGNLTLSHIPEEYRTEEICKLSVSHSSVSLAHVPKKYLTDELYNSSLEQNVNVFSFYPRRLKTQELCERVMKEDPELLSFVPDKYKTVKMCKDAMESGNSYMIQFVTDEYKKTQHYADFVKSMSAYDLSYLRKNIPDEFLSEDQIAGLISYGNSLDDIPEHMRTPEFYERLYHECDLPPNIIPEDKRSEIVQKSYEEIFINYDYATLDSYKKQISYLKEQYASPSPSQNI